MPKEYYAIIKVTKQGQQELMLSASPTDEEALNDFKEMIISRQESPKRNLT